MTTLVLGATGFIGSAVMNQLISRDGNTAIGFVHTDNAAEQLSRYGIAATIGDINDSASLRGAMSQASTVICCMSYVGDDEQQCVHVNQHGIRNIASVAAAVGVERLLYRQHRGRVRARPLSRLAGRQRTSQTTLTCQ